MTFVRNMDNLNRGGVTNSASTSTAASPSPRRATSSNQVCHLTPSEIESLRQDKKQGLAAIKALIAADKAR